MASPIPESFRTLSELEAAASRRVTEHVWAYIQGGAGDERTMRANENAFRRWFLRPRVLVDVSSVDIRSRILGRSVNAPFFISPMAYQAEVHPEGELAVARSASERNVLAVYSTLSSAPFEEISKASGSAPYWFQLYLQPDFEVTRKLIERAERCGASAIVLTVDVPVLSVRDRQTMGGFAIDSTVPIGAGSDVVPPAREPVLQGPVYRLRTDAAATWSTLGEIQSVTRLPVVVKGVLTPEDARLAVEHGAAGIVVSNHGGRQLDGAPASLDVLPAVVAEVSDRIEVYLDGGVRRAADVLIAMGLGAKAVGIGRPVLWALAADGSEGVGRYLSLLSTELATSIALCGRRSIAEIDRTLCSPTTPGLRVALHDEIE